MADEEAADAGLMAGDDPVEDIGQATQEAAEDAEGCPKEVPGATDDVREGSAPGGSADAEEVAGSTAEAVEADQHPGTSPADAASVGNGDNDMPDACDNTSKQGGAADPPGLPGEVVEDGVAENTEARAPPALPRRQGSVRMPLPPPVDIDQVDKPPVDQGHKEEHAENLQASAPRDGSSISPTSESGRRRRSPQNSQQALAKQIEEMCARSIHASARYGNIAKLQDHVAVPATVSEKDSAGFTPLHFAACYGHTSAVEMLLERNAPVDPANHHGWTPLHVAARNGHAPGVKTLLVSAGGRARIGTRTGASTGADKQTDTQK